MPYKDRLSSKGYINTHLFTYSLEHTVAYMYIAQPNIMTGKPRLQVHELCYGNAETIMLKGIMMIAPYLSNLQLVR